MFGIGPATRIYLAAGRTDMRKGFEGLFGLVRDRLSCDPLSGHVFLFTNAQRNRLKLLFRDGSGLWVCAKRLEKGRFRWPEAEGEESKITLSHEELTLLIGGIDLAQTSRRAWHRVKLAA
ncbi:MAG: IS66 family insertion sequence element accessory protein TnpB [Acidobacteriota bacterium]